MSCWKVVFEVLADTWRQTVCHLAGHLDVRVHARRIRCARCNRAIFEDRPRLPR